MEKKKLEYKNAKLTKSKIASSYLALSIDKEKFSVTDVVKRAGINRGTFYLHFENLLQVQEFVNNELLQRFAPIENSFRMVDLAKTPEIALETINGILMADLNYFKLVIKASKNTNLISQIKTTILNSISNNFQVMKYVTNYEHFKVLVEYVVGGILDVYNKFIFGEINCSASELTKFLSALIKDGIRGFIINAN